MQPNIAHDENSTLAINDVRCVSAKNVKLFAVAGPDPDLHMLYSAHKANKAYPALAPSETVSGATTSRHRCRWVAIASGQAIAPESDSIDHGAIAAMNIAVIISSTIIECTGRSSDR